MPGCHLYQHYQLHLDSNSPKDTWVWVSVIRKSSTEKSNFFSLRRKCFMLDPKDVKNLQAGNFFYFYWEPSNEMVTASSFYQVILISQMPLTRPCVIMVSNEEGGGGGWCRYESCDGHSVQYQYSIIEGLCGGNTPAKLKQQKQSPISSYRILFLLAGGCFRCVN